MARKSKSQTPKEESIGPLNSLADPTRRLLYNYVAANHTVTRDKASSALGIDRSTAAYHLDRLVEEKLLTATFARPEGRGGPGAGRPTKHYARAGREFAVSIPHRDYRLVAELLARATVSDESRQVRHAVEKAAVEMGQELALQTAGDLFAFLEYCGFEPFQDGNAVRARNCPFHQLAQNHKELICGMNLTMLRAAAGEIDEHVSVELEPGTDRCCVAFKR